MCERLPSPPTQKPLLQECAETRHSSVLCRSSVVLSFVTVSKNMCSARSQLSYTPFLLFFPPLLNLNLERFRLIRLKVHGRTKEPFSHTARYPCPPCLEEVVHWPSHFVKVIVPRMNEQIDSVHHTSLRPTQLEIVGSLVC